MGRSLSKCSFIGNFNDDLYPPPRPRKTQSLTSVEQKIIDATRETFYIYPTDPTRYGSASVPTLTPSQRRHQESMELFPNYDSFPLVSD